MYKKIYLIYLIIIIVLSYIFVTDYSSNTNNSNFTWPTENYTNITSYFGFRIHPTTFNTSYHSGIDIGAPEKTEIHSICNGIVSFIGFNGAYGYSIIIKNENFEILYGHVSPNYIINIGDAVLKGSLIGSVGPKYVESSPYTDSSGKYTNGKTTGPHLHLEIKKDGIAVNPLDYF